MPSSPGPPPHPPHQQHAKRTRILLSCAPCRSSKLKCDRASPCGQCLKKGRAGACAYAPKPERERGARGRRTAKGSGGDVAERLRRLEGLVRELIDDDGNGGGGGFKGDDGGGDGSGSGGSGGVAKGEGAGADAGGSVVLGGGDGGSGDGGSGRGRRATNYVGGTHFMAILEDLEDLKNYFDVPEEEDDDNDDYPDTLHENAGPAELLMFTTGTPSNKREMLALLPEKSVMDRLMNRYFNSNSPSQHVIHQPTFTKQYNAFLKNPQGTDLHWIATLFMVMALGILFSTFQSPHELELDSDVPAIDRFNQYRGICGWALIRGKYYQPGPFTLQAFLLYSEGEFLSNRMSQMNSYLLSATLIRVMLKMGLHRDPSKLPGITPYEGEMRRRMWNLAIQIDLLVAFHLGLPCMIHGIESDTELPRNLIDSDFDEDTKELPPPRPSSDYTPLTYPIYKAKLARVFGLVARQAHALTLPSYAEVMAVDAKVNAIYDSIPYFMKVKPLEESVTDPPMQVVQRFGLGSLYQKSRCVLHRRYLVEVEPRPEHDYSRRACIDAAVELLGYQRTMIEAGAPGGVLSEKAWFASSLAINDFLLADMILALAIQNEKYTQLSNDSGGTLPSKAELLHILKQSYSIWLTVAKKVPECTKSTEVVRKMLRRIHLRTGMDIGIGTSEAVDTGGGSSNSSSGIPTKTTASRNTSDDASLMANLTIDTYMEPPSSTESSNNGPSVQDFGMMEPNFMTMGDGVQDQMALDPWSMQNGYDWSQFDAITRGPGDVIQTIPQIMSTSTTSASSSQHQQQPAWLDGTVIEDFSNFLATTDTWGSAPSG